MALRVMAMAEMRLEVLLEADRSGETLAAVSRPHGISRETSRQPLNQAQRMPATIRERVHDLRHTAV